MNFQLCFFHVKSWKLWGAERGYSGRRSFRMVRLTSPSVAVPELENVRENCVAAGARRIRKPAPQAVEPSTAVAK